LRKDLWEKEEIDFLMSNYLKKPTEQICSYLNRTRDSVYWKASELGLRKYYKPKQETRLETLSVADLAYLAGIIDGEAMVSLHCSKNFAHPRVVITNTNRQLIEWLEYVLNRKAYKKPSSGKRRDCWAVAICDFKNVKALLRSILPYLRAKRKQAELVLEYCQYRELKLKKPGSKGFLDKYEQEIVRNIRVLNRRGI